MSRRAIVQFAAPIRGIRPIALSIAATSALTIPTIAWASSGGAGFGGGGSGSGSASQAGSSASPSTTKGGVVQPANVNVRASGNGITVSTRASAMLRRGLSFTGTVPSSDAGKIVEVERRGRQTGWRWTPTAHGTAGSNGSFSAFWPANHIGEFDVRAVIESRAGSTARAGAASPAVGTIVYRPSIATFYGTGFYGSRTACGVKLTRTTLGTANRTLRCGTPVAIYYRGRMIVVPVIDRGPYANHADWDLTEATAQKLHTPGIASIGAVSVPSH